ncbi:HlyD family efflux transporter periplasmic adaptor subunit [Ideonella sp. B7]|uniref:efflux RND transporter periplasmic adaptor subunit n=1 Tax=Ideonella benzenivorans TaxID=2831643 RepID=UPI001CED19D6|nr:HlyD family efflux transporter periplasmic adaptor subunit [Ideonella benzenivorans]MCA6216222.1 HlyD family efflux transporter periplasmic adaptor subunit [Ideonella benzenivorans]
MTRRSWITLSLAATAAVLLLAWAFRPRPVEVEVAPARFADFETTVDEDGRTRLRDRFVVAAPLAGQLQRIAWREGDSVQAGQVLATLQPTLSPLLGARDRAQLQAALSAAQATLQTARHQARAAQAHLAQTENDLRHSEALARQGFVSASKRDSDALAADQARAEHEAARAAEETARFQQQQAQAALQAASRATPGEPFAVHAPISGRVLKVNQTSETTVALGTPLLELGDTRRLEVLAELLTTDALQVHPGSPVRIEGWGRPQPLQARVRLIEPGGFTKVSALGVEEQRVNVLMDLTSPPAQWAALGDGYRVGVRILTRQQAHALTVPVGALFPLPASQGGAAAGWGVFVVDGGQARLQPVSLKARNAQQAWVGETLREGTQVIIYPPDTVRDGARVAPRQP